MRRWILLPALIQFIACGDSEPAGPQNNPPEILHIVITNIHETILFSVEVRDEDQDEITYTWTVTTGGRFVGDDPDPLMHSVTYERVDMLSQVIVTVVVSDGTDTDSRSITIDNTDLSAIIAE